MKKSTTTAADPKSTAASDDDRRTLRTFYTTGFFALCLVFVFFRYVLPPLSTVASLNPSCALLSEEDGGPFFWVYNNLSNPELHSTLLSCGTSYKQLHGEWLVVGFAVLYLTMQSFVIPGTGVLSVLSGALFPIWQAEVVVALCILS